MQFNKIIFFKKQTEEMPVSCLEHKTVELNEEDLVAVQGGIGADPPGPGAPGSMWGGDDPWSGMGGDFNGLNGIGGNNPGAGGLGGLGGLLGGGGLGGL